MIRDYARFCAVGNRRRYSGKQSHAGLWLFTIFLFVIFTLGLVFLGKYHRHGSVSNHLQKGVFVVKQQEAQDVRLPAATSQVIGTKVTGKSSLVQHQSPVSATTTTAPQFEFAIPQKLSQDAAQKIAAESSVESKKISDNSVAIDVEKGKTAQASAAQVPMPTYILEVIKTKDRAAAEKMRARLALAGVESNIIIFQEQKVTFYKINLGPYDKNTVSAKKQLLNKNNIKVSISKAS